MRKSDPPGALIEDWGDDIEELGPLEVTLQLPGREDACVPVTLESARDGGRHARNCGASRAIGATGGSWS